MSAAVPIQFSYASKAFAAGAPHGADHDCFMCADARRSLGHVPMEPHFARIARLRLAGIYVVPRRSTAFREACGAGHLGISVDEYRAHVADGEKWCSACRRWQPRDEFGPHRRRPDGLNTECKEANRERGRRNMARLRIERAKGAVG